MIMKVRPTGHVERGEGDQWMDRRVLADTDHIPGVFLVVVHIDRAAAGHTGVGRLHMVAAGKAPHPLRARSKTCHPDE